MILHLWILFIKTTIAYSSKSFASKVTSDYKKYFIGACFFLLQVMFRICAGIFQVPAIESSDLCWKTSRVFFHFTCLIKSCSNSKEKHFESTILMLTWNLGLWCRCTLQHKQGLSESWIYNKILELQKGPLDV